MRTDMNAAVRVCTVLVGVFLSCGLTARAADDRLTLWYDKPAVSALNEGLPVGNGRMGGLICGGTGEERIVLNEDSLWTGDDNPSGDYKKMGAYQVLGELRIAFPGHERATDYRRDLDIGQALAHVAYKAGGVSYVREFFASHADRVLVGKISGDKAGACSGALAFVDGHGAATAASDNALEACGQLPNGLAYATRIVVVPQGGKIEAGSGKIVFTGCDSLLFFVTCGTNYAMDFAKGYRGDDPRPRVEALAAAAAAKDYEELKRAHEADFKSLFGRASVELGSSTQAQRALPFDKRKIEAATACDPELERLFFQYGRYLLISCSRPGGLPANLQGLWNESNNPMWYSDYHTNINIQMNYWPAEVSNLSECHLPLFDLVRSQIPAWRRTALSAPELKTPAGNLSTRGFAVRTSHNIFGGMGWKWDETANAWYCQHFWEHYAFTRDKAYLRETAYPVIREVVQYWEDHLKELPDGRLVVPHAWSPEHGPTEDGVSYAQEIVWDLFSHYVEAEDILGIDPEERKKAAAMRDKLATPGVGSWGQLMEWMTEKQGTNPRIPELDTPQDHHRHTSHLFALFPGSQISPKKTPDLAAAAKVSLAARGDAGDVREWSFAWRTALWARLFEGDHAHGQFQQLFSARNTCINLFGLHPPMQMDGNFGITAATCEMLLQSQDGEIRLLPALPSVWPEGAFKGFRARGGFEVDASWTGGTLATATVRNVSAEAGTCRLAYGKAAVTADLAPGEGRTFGADAWKL